MSRDAQGRFTEPASGKPASGTPLNPPFEVGNLVAVKHGTRSPRLVDPLAQSLADTLLEVRPDLYPHPYAVAAWARAEARCMLLAEYVRKVGLVDEEKNTVRLGADIARLEKLAAQLRQQLGLDPKAEAELMRARRESVDPGDVLRGILEHGRQVMADRAIEATP